MTDAQKKAARAWENKQRFDMTQGGSMTLGFIIDEERKRSNNNPTGISLPEYMTKVHPVLYYMFVIDWSKVIEKRIPRRFKSGHDFGQYVIKEWLDVCKSKSYFKEGMLNNFTAITQITDIMNQLTDNEYHLYFENEGQRSADYALMEERMYAWRQACIDRETQEEQERQEALRELAREQQVRAAEAARMQKLQAEKEKEQSAVEQLMLDTNRMLSESGLSAFISLEVELTLPATPYVAVLHLNGIEERFTALSFASAIKATKRRVTEIINERIAELKRQQQRDEITKAQQQAQDDFNAAQNKWKEMIRQAEQQMQEQRAAFEAQMQQLTDKLNAI